MRHIVTALLTISLLLQPGLPPLPSAALTVQFSWPAPRRRHPRASLYRA